jgi:hypothetical protein
VLLLSQDVIRYGVLLLNNKSSALIFACFGFKAAIFGHEQQALLGWFLHVCRDLFVLIWFHSSNLL